MGLIDQLGPGPVALDTPVFIYLFQADNAWLPHLLPLFEAIDAGRRTAFTSSAVTMDVRSRGECSPVTSWTRRCTTSPPPCW